MPSWSPPTRWTWANTCWGSRPGASFRGLTSRCTPASAIISPVTCGPSTPARRGSSCCATCCRSTSSSSTGAARGWAARYGLSRDRFWTSLRAGRGLMRRLRDADIEIGATECGACRIQMEQGITKRTLHPVKLLSLGYGLNPQLCAALQRPEAAACDVLTVEILLMTVGHDHFAADRSRTFFRAVSFSAWAKQDVQGFLWVANVVRVADALDFWPSR